MLILTRRVGETIMIGSNVTVTVLGVKGNQVRIGINAPKDVEVHREEIYERIRHERSHEALLAIENRSALRGEGFVRDVAYVLRDHPPIRRMDDRSKLLGR